MLLAAGCVSSARAESGPAAVDSAPSAGDEKPGATPSAREYAFVFLKTGPTQVSADEGADLQERHLANIRRLAEEGWLLVAGPYGRPCPDPSLRGLFVFGTDTDRARELAATDPAIQAGVFVVEIHPWRSASPLGELPELERELHAASEQEAERELLRPYVLASTRSDSDALERALDPLAREGLLLFRGEFGAEREGESLILLDARTLDEAREMLEFGGAELECTLYPWFSTSALAELSQPRPGT